MNTWAPIVHGRTYSVDFRPNLIALPADFGVEQIGWAWQYITAATQTVHPLRRHPRWLLFKRQSDTGVTHCVMGVVCMAAAVCTQEEFTCDEHGRPLYVFLGYVTQSLTPVNFPICDLEHFAPLYENVIMRWHEQNYHRNAQTLNPVAYTELAFPSSLQSTKPSIQLNEAPQAVAMWPFANKSYDVALWSVAAQHRGDISLCLGLENISSAVNSLFANVTVEQFPADARIGYTVQRAQQRETLIPGVPPNLHPMSGQPEIQGISDADKGPSSEEQSHSEWLNELGKWIKRLLALLFGALDAVVGEVIKPKEKNPGQPQQRSAQPADQARRWSPRVTPSTAPPSSVCPIHEMIPDWQKQAEKSKVFKDEQPSRYTSNIFTRSSKDKGGVQVAGDGSSSNNHNNGDVDRKVQLS